MKRKLNIPRIIWVTCLFLFLIIVLLMVMDYKINFQYLVHNYLYFYECDDNLCVTEVADDTKKLFVSYDCGYEKCPEYKKRISDSYALLEQNEVKMLYNYKKDAMISKDYDEYEVIDNSYIIVKKNNLYGIINTSNEEIVKPQYDAIGKYNENNYLTGYNSESIIARKNEKYGLISYRTGKLIEEFKYTEETLEQLTNIMKETE